MAHVVLAHPPQTRDQLWWAVRALFGVTIPRTRVCPDHCSPFDAFADAYFRECTIGQGDPYPISRAIWHASRGLAGKSKTLSILGLFCGYVDGADITILGGSMAQSTNVHEYMTKGMESENLPRDMSMDVTATKITLTNLGRVRPLPASQRNVRGPHPSLLLMDEVDEMELEIYDAALGQPMPQMSYLRKMVETMTVISSTWQNAAGTLTEIFRRAEEQEPINEQGDPKTPIYRWCYKENLDVNNPKEHYRATPDGPINVRSTGWLTQKTVDEKKDSVSAEMFRIEYDLGEPSIGNRAIDTEKLDECFCLTEDDPGGKPIKVHHEKDWDEWWFFNPEPNALYVAGADWAKEQDKTVVSIVRVDQPWLQLCYLARVNRTNYPRMVGLANKAVRKYGVGLNGFWHDSTGLGNVVNDYLDTRARAFQMTGDKRTDLLSTYVNSIEKVKWRLPKMLKVVYTEHKYCSTGDLYSSAAGFHLPDTICSLALAHHAAKRVHKTAAPIAVAKDGTPGKLQRNFEHPPEGSAAVVPPPTTASPINLVV